MVSSANWHYFISQSLTLIPRMFAFPLINIDIISNKYQLNYLAFLKYIVTNCALEKNYLQQKHIINLVNINLIFVKILFMHSSKIWCLFIINNEFWFPYCCNICWRNLEYSKISSLNVIHCIIYIYTKTSTVNINLKWLISPNFRGLGILLKFVLL